MKLMLKGILIAVLSGVVVTWISINLIGFLAAITYPENFFAWAKHYGFLHITLYLINFLQQFLGVGIISALISYFLVKNFVSIWFYVALTFFITQISIMYLYVPSEYGLPLQQYYVDLLPHLFVLSVSIFVTAFIVSRNKKVKTI